MSRAQKKLTLALAWVFIYTIASCYEVNFEGAPPACIVLWYAHLYLSTHAVVRSVL